MFRKAGILLIGTSLLFVLVGAGRLSKKEVKLEIVWEKEFDKKIEEVAFGETEDGKLYPKIVVFDDEVRFYNKEGEKLKAVTSSWLSVVISPQSRYVGIEKVTKRQKGDERLIEWTIFSEKGKEVCKGEYIAKEEFEGFRLYAISDNGYFVMGNSADHVLVFFDRKGGELKEINIFKDDQWDPYRALPRAFSQAGDYFVILGTEEFIMNVRETVDSDAQEATPNVYIILFDENANELWRKPFTANWTRHVSWSPDRNYILANGHSSAGKQPIKYTQALFDISGNLLNSYQIRMHNSSYGFSGNGEYLVLGGENEIQLIQSRTGNIIWKQKFSWPTETRRQEWKWIKKVSVSDEGAVIVLNSSYERYSNPDGSSGYEEAETEVMLFNRSGELLSKKNIEEAQFLKINSKGTEVSITSKKSLGKIMIH
jgi:hypothetical protein